MDGLRPTASRARETVFNWLGQDLSGKICLDLFAGSGALGFEAASRGANRVVLVERSRLAVNAITENIEELQAVGVEVYLQDALVFLRENLVRFDIVFVDPPFGLGLEKTVVESVKRHLKANAFVYVESGDRIMAPSGFGDYRNSKIGKSHCQLFICDGN